MAGQLVKLMRLRTHIYDKHGMSLVEVLAALSVFVIGILVIVRLFPPGFFVVKQSENFTLANRLAQSELERLKGTTANLPTGILGWDVVHGGVLINMDPENMDDLPGLAGLDPYYYSDVNKFRRIYSEATKIPAPTVYRGASTPYEASIYVLNFSPVEWVNDDSIKVYSGPLRRRAVVRDVEDRQDADQGQMARSSSEYSIDYDEAVLYVRLMSYDRWFIISYSYWKSSGGRPELRPVLSSKVFVPANALKAEIPSALSAHVADDTGFVGIDAGSDTVHRSFEIPKGAGWSANDPYQYRVLDDVRGVLEFNPAGYGYEEVTAWGKVTLTAYIDYDVLDWHIIREERKIPEDALITSQADLDAKLTLRFIKNAGATNAADPNQPATVEMDGSTYMGLSSRLQFGILAIDMQTGEWFNESSISPINNKPIMVVNYKDGIIRFNGASSSSSSQGMAGRTFRIYYRAEGDWALQVFKTYESYRRSYDEPPLDYREWYGPEATASDQVPYFSESIYFARCYSGMSVALDYTYRIRVQGGYAYYNVDGDTFQTSLASGYMGTCYIEPRERIARLLGVSVSDVEIIKISKVYGVSVGTRVIWREGSRGFNGGQWRKVDLQTYLMRLQD